VFLLRGMYTTLVLSAIRMLTLGFRAFADYIVCSLILHFFCVNFIN
jgi:hypothetical protein